MTTKPPASNYGHHPSHVSSTYSHRMAVGDSSMNMVSPEVIRQLSEGHGTSVSRVDQSAWEPDENVLACRLCNRRFTAFIRRHHCRFCGRVICYRCSASRHPIPPERVVQNPFTDSYERVERTRLHRVCDTCAPIVRGLATAETDNCPRSSSTIFTVTSPPMSRAAQVLDIHDPTASDLDDIFLIECPVCRTDLRVFEDDDLQAVHVATCLEGQSTSPSFGQGERHLVYRLTEGSPLIGIECVICFEEFEIGDKLSRTECLCNFHRHCFRSWIHFGNGCPVHFIRV